MSFAGNNDNRFSKEANKPSRKKILYPVKESLRNYLKQHGREVKLPVVYRDLLRFTYSISLKDKNGQPTSWETTLYDMKELEFLRQGLLGIYAILKTEGDLSFIDHLDVARIDYCAFGNSNPFRIRIVNKYNDNYDHYYIKIADASRIYGLELEHILSPNRMTFLTSGDTLVEEHIPGIPGDIFIDRMMKDPAMNRIRLAKEFVKFNERCFVRLLGDMRSYNFVMNITPDIEDYQYRIRAIDFDQQCYEGRKNLYLPQFFKENYPMVELVLQHLNKNSIEQYQTEEKTMMAFRLSRAKYKIKQLLDIMKDDPVMPEEKLTQLKNELADHHQNSDFLKCNTAGDIVKTNLKQMLRKNLRLISGLENRGWF
jgi:hypothetical protein